MARGKSAIDVEITEGAIRLRYGARILTLRPRFSTEDSDDADLIVDLDEIAFWDAPHDEEEVPIELMPKLTEAIERQCDAHGMSVAFE
jgi:hypothetical protein